MTWANIKSTGQGKLRFRFHIEGARFDWVTDRDMEKAATTGSGAVAARKFGLLRDGLEFGDDVDLPNARLKCRAPRIMIADINGQATYAFTIAPSKTTWLTSELSSTGTALTVQSNTGWVAGDILHLNTEAMYVTGTSGSFTINVNRSVYGTQSQKHFTLGAATGGVGVPECNNNPISLEGRRCRLYVYGDGDDPQGNGTLVWNGVVIGDAETDDLGATWSVRCGGLDRLLDKSFGRDPNLTTIRPRGVYYSAFFPFYVAINEWNDDVFPGTVRREAAVSLYGFWESQDAFIADLDAELVAQQAAAGFTQRVRARRTGDQTWDFFFQTGGTPYVMGIEIKSLIDTCTNGTAWDFVNWTDTLAGLPFRPKLDTAQANYEYKIGMLSGQVRGAAFYFRAAATSWPGVDATDLGTYPRNRIYVDSDLTAFASAETLILEFPDGSTVDCGTAFSLNTTTNAIDLVSTPVPFGSYDHNFGGYGTVFLDGSEEPTDKMINVKPKLAPLIGDAVSDLSGLMYAIINDGPEYANLGVIPLLSSSEVDVLSLANVEVATRGRPLASARKYTDLPAEKLSAILAEECKLAGVYMSIGTTGKLTFKVLSGPTTGHADVALGPAQILMNDGPPTWNRNAMGLINTVQVQDGYNASEDKWTGDVVSVTDATAFGVTQTARKVSIKPWSVAITKPTLGDVVDLGGALFGMFSYPYASITVSVPLTVFATAVCGASATLESTHLFDTETGARLTSGQTTRAALITGRRWDMQRGRGEITAYLPLGTFAGYTPAAYLSSVSGAGTSWTLTVTDEQPFSGTTLWPPGAALTDYFPVGTRVIVHEWDNDTPGYTAGTVTAVTATTVGVTFDAAWFGMGADQWVLEYARATDSSLTAAARKFVFIAQSDGVVDFATAKPARTFGG